MSNRYEEKLAQEVLRELKAAQGQHNRMHGPRETVRRAAQWYRDTEDKRG